MFKELAEEVKYGCDKLAEQNKEEVMRLYTEAETTLKLQNETQQQCAIVEQALINQALLHVKLNEDIDAQIDQKIKL